MDVYQSESFCSKIIKSKLKLHENIFLKGLKLAVKVNKNSQSYPVTVLFHKLLHAKTMNMNHLKNKNIKLYIVILKLELCVRRNKILYNENQ